MCVCACINLSCKSKQASNERNILTIHSEKSSPMEEDHHQQQQQPQQSSCSDSEEVDQIRGSSSIVIPAQLIYTAEEDGFEKKEQSW